MPELHGGIFVLIARGREAPSEFLRELWRGRGSGDFWSRIETSERVYRVHAPGKDDGGDRDRNNRAQLEKRFHGWVLDGKIIARCHGQGGIHLFCRCLLAWHELMTESKTSAVSWTTKSLPERIVANHEKAARHWGAHCHW